MKRQDPSESGNSQVPLGSHPVSLKPVKKKPLSYIVRNPNMAALNNNELVNSCKHGSGCGTSDKVKCKSCGTDMCKTCKRNSADGTPVPGGNSAHCGKCHKAHGH